jgi:hypothetical protein
VGHKELTTLLDELENTKPPYVAVILSQTRVWVKKYAWFAEGPAPAGAKECPSHDDQFFVAVRNPSARSLTVEFECQSQHGRIRFDKSSTQGFKYTEIVEAVPQGPSGSVPIVRNTRIAVMDTGEVSDVIEVKASTFEASPTRRAICDAEIDRIVLSFP